jgi:Ca-activated chloride channel family protein
MNRRVDWSTIQTMQDMRTMDPKNMILTVITILFPLLFGVTLPPGALAGENPDELYNQGRFAEAEKAYAASDMDHPKDTRYRYNRGCAAYQNSDYQGAAAAFSSVLRRAQDDETRFKSAYNLGNTAFKQGDLASAEAHYKQAILWNPGNKDAKYNLELVLRELEKQKQSKDQGPEQPSEQDAGKPEKKADQEKGDKQAKGPDKPSGEEKTPDERTSQAKDQGKDKGPGQSGQDEPSQPKEGAEPGERPKAEQDAAQDLSGELKPMQGLPEEKGHEQAQGAVMSMIDKKKAEALLDNVKEDRSKFLRLRVPEDKKHGVPSGKDW